MNLTHINDIDANTVLQNLPLRQAILVNVTLEQSELINQSVAAQTLLVEQEKETINSLEKERTSLLHTCQALENTLSENEKIEKARKIQQQERILALLQEREDLQNRNKHLQITLDYRETIKNKFNMAQDKSELLKRSYVFQGPIQETLGDDIYNTPIPENLNDPS